MTAELEIVSGTRWREQAAAQPPAIIEGLLPAQCLAFIAGEPGVGKSWMLWDLALTVSSGADFLGRYPVKLHGGTLVIASEGDAKASIGRVTALARGKGLDPITAIDDLHVLWRSSFRLTDPTHVLHVVEHVRTHGIRLVLIDTLFGAWGGRENDSEAWGEVMRIGVRPLLAAGATVALVHHTAKISDGAHSRSAGQRLRGSSAMHGSRDCLLLLTRSGSRGDPHVRVTVELRDDAPVHPFAFRTPAPGQQIGDDDTFALEWRSLELANASTSDADLRQRILDTVAQASGKWSRNTLRVQLGVQKQRVYATVAELAQEGVLVVGAPPMFLLSIPDGKPAEQAGNRPGNTVPEAKGVPAVPLVEGREQAEHLELLPALATPPQPDQREELRCPT